MNQSTRLKKVAVSAAMMKTMIVVSMTSRRVGQTTLATSLRTCWMNWVGLVLVAMSVLSAVLFGARYALHAPFSSHRRHDRPVRPRIAPGKPRFGHNARPGKAQVLTDCQVFAMSSAQAPSDAARAEFAARLARVTNRDNAGILMVGPSEQIVLPRKTVVRKAKSAEIAGNALYPLSLLAAGVLGALGVVAGRYATFHLAQPLIEEPGSMAELVLGGVIGLAAAFGLSQLFKLSSKEHAALQGIGVFVMSCAFHNIMHIAPGPAAMAFSPDYVQRITELSPPNSLRIGRNYYTLDGSVPPEDPVLAEPAAGTVSAEAAPAEAEKPAVTILRAGHDGTKTKAGHKTVKAAAGD